MHVSVNERIIGKDKDAKPAFEMDQNFIDLGMELNI